VPEEPAILQSESWRKGWSRGFYGLGLDESKFDHDCNRQELRAGYERGRIAWVLATPLSPPDF